MSLKILLYCSVTRPVTGHPMSCLGFIPCCTLHPLLPVPSLCYNTLNMLPRTSFWPGDTMDGGLDCVKTSALTFLAPWCPTVIGQMKFSLMSLSFNAAEKWVTYFPEWDTLLFPSQPPLIPNVTHSWCWEGQEQKTAHTSLTAVHWLNSSAMNLPKYNWL